MFDSTRRSFWMGSPALSQYDPCKPHQDAMAIYAKKIAEFSRQMREALARGDKGAADQAATIARDAGKKYEEHKRMYEQCRPRGTSSPFRPAQAPPPPGPTYGQQPYPVDYPVRPYPMRIPFGFGPMFSTGPMAYGGPTT